MGVGSLPQKGLSKMSHKINLNIRLQTIFEGLLKGLPVWDLCCDHGLLGFRCYESGDFPEIYFVDRVPKIIDQLRTQFETYSPTIENKMIKVQFHAVDAGALNQKITGNLIIAGVGLKTSLDILTQLRDQGRLGAQRLILCPQNGGDHWAEEWAQCFGAQYTLTHQVSVFERQRARTIWFFDKQEEVHYSELATDH